jgi:hypothetical protein
MSLETSPSIRSEWELRLEIFLSTCWRIYSYVEKYLYRRRKWGPSDCTLTKLTAEAAEAYLKYSGTLELRYLEKAIEKFWQAKNYQDSSNNQTESLYCLYLEGYAEKTSKRNLLDSVRANLKGQDAKLRIVRKKFRPDVAFRVPGNYGIWSGFALEIQTRDLETVRRTASLLTSIQTKSDISVYRFHTTDLKQPGLENFHIRHMRELLPLIEAAADQTLAQSLCKAILRIDAGLQLLCSSEEMAKIFLIARVPLPDQFNENGWRILGIENAQWRKSKKFDPSIIQDAPVERNSPDEGSYIPMPAPSLAVIQDVIVTGGDVIISDQSLINIDPAANPAFSFVAGRQEIVVGTPANLGTVAVRVQRGDEFFVPEGILLSSRADTNWFHWLIETLPKLFYLDAEVSKDVPVIISSRIPETAKESLQLLTDRPIIEISALEATRVGKLFVSSPLLFHPDPVELHLKPVTNTINTEALIWLRERILGMARENLGEARGEPSIYVKRSGGARSIVNSRRVDKMLSKFGFVALDPVQMSFLEQVLAFNSAERIVLVGGASMANLIFCSPSAVVVTLRSKFTFGYKMPEILAGVAGARVLPVSGRPVGNLFRNSYLEKMHAHYKVNLHRLKRIACN